MPDSWKYEPKNVIRFWKRMGDRPFQQKFYSRLAQFSRVLDVGARGYNRLCKGFISSNKTKYFQMEPHPPAVEEMNNDGLLKCRMQQVAHVYPQFAHTFDAVVDFGVFGWGETHRTDNATEMLDDMRAYVASVRWLLKEGGMWALKVDKGWVKDEKAVFESIIRPFFSEGGFDGQYESGHRVKGGNFRFYFFYKRFKPPTAAANESSCQRATEQKHPIELENERSGTTEWALTKPALNREIEGYMSKTSIPQGQIIRLFYNTASDEVLIEVFRTGWYGGKGARRVGAPVTVQGVVQDIPRPDKGAPPVPLCLSFLSCLSDIPFFPSLASLFSLLLSTPSAILCVCVFLIFSLSQMVWWRVTGGSRICCAPVQIGQQVYI